MATAEAPDPHSPDNLAFNPLGNLWIATDGDALGSNNGLFAVPLDGPPRGHVTQFLTAPRCGHPTVAQRKSAAVGLLRTVLGTTRTLPR